jgi:hypothetical protein
MTPPYIKHPDLGIVQIVPRANARRVIARWQGDNVKLTVPAGITAERLSAAIDELAPRLLKRRPTLAYHDGQTITLDGLTINITHRTIKPGHVAGTLLGTVATISVAAELDFADPNVTKAVSRTMCNIAAHEAARILLPRARALAEQLGVKPASWGIMKGYRTLGTCNTRREIRLSHALVFLTPELRDYIVCHELAHLSEMSHSPRFHVICNSYCKGREHQLIAALKSYTWCIQRC